MKVHTKRIEALDPIQDHQEISHILAFEAFVWDSKKALEFALFRTYAVPSISKLLSETGEFKERPYKRYDDTELILSEIAQHGYDSERARKAFRRMNDMHRYYDIANDDLLYVLSTFVFVPFRWMEKYAWRPLTEDEKLAAFTFYREMGKRMGIKNIPEHLDEFEIFHDHYEDTYFEYLDSNKEIGDYTVDLLLGFYLPKWLYWLGRPFAYSMMDEKLMNAMGFPKPSKLIKAFTQTAMRFRKFILQYTPDRKKPFYQTEVKRKTYPEGYRIEELGTFPQASKCPIAGIKKAIGSLN